MLILLIILMIILLQEKPLKIIFVSENRGKLINICPIQELTLALKCYFCSTLNKLNLKVLSEKLNNSNVKVRDVKKDGLIILLLIQCILLHFKPSMQILKGKTTRKIIAAKHVKRLLIRNGNNLHYKDA